MGKPQQEAVRSGDQYQQFQADVTAFLSEHVYRGFSQPFELDAVSIDEVVKQARPLANARVLTVKGLGEESIAELDRDWAHGLYEVGQKYGVELRFPSWYLEK